ncbi:MAG: putative toxin-antitoxin system toxin component, PIN family [Anaerolineae bacterium]|nr:putative toxin-antitoxin system toxin component, PIN family [Anaerolineae bacterium]
MAVYTPMRIVLDTNVLFEGLTKQGGSCSLVVDAWQGGLLTVCVSTTLVYEYADVFSRKLSENRWHTVKPILERLLERHVEFVNIYYSWRPVSPDPGDDHVINCAMNANASVVTLNLRDFQVAKRNLGLRVMSPFELVNLLVD